MQKMGCIDWIARNYLSLSIHRQASCMKPFLLLLICTGFFPAFAQNPEAYKLFSSSGKPVSYGKMMSEIADADVVFFGELHNNSINHWLELQVAKDLFKIHGSSLVFAMEMFETDDQFVLNEYLGGLIEERHFLKEAKIWDNYSTDYKPIVELAKENKLKVIASNIPRRYANLVYRKGIAALDSLPAEAQQWIAPLPFEIDLTLPGYMEMIASMGGHGAAGSAENLARSQASKDATMAYFIGKSLPGKVLHINGAYHSKNGEGILWYLRKNYPDIKIATLHCVEQENMEQLDEQHRQAADFIIIVPSDMTKTY